ARWPSPSARGSASSPTKSGSWWWRSGLHLDPEHLPHDETDAERGERYAKGDRHHLAKTPSEVHVLRNRGIVGEEQDDQHGEHQRQRQRQEIVAKDQIRRDEDGYRDDVGEAGVQGRAAGV